MGYFDNVIYPPGYKPSSFAFNTDEEEDCDGYVGRGLAIMRPENDAELEALIKGLTYAFQARKREMRLLSSKTRH